MLLAGLIKPITDALTFYFPLPRRRHIRSLLHEANATYRKLSDRKRFRFENRVIRFIDGFEFVPREPFKEINLEMRVILGGEAARVTLFLPEECFDYYHRIIVYPAKYPSTITSREHSGEVNPGARIIVFSWDAVIKGLHREDDGLNLLLHEYAHALWLEHKLMREQYEIFNNDALEHYVVEAEKEVLRVRTIENHFLRRYAANSQEEFFAVAVESFFERPAGIKEHMPHLYKALQRLFNQDPLTLR